MVEFEGYERRIAKINKVLAEYGLKDLDEAKALCDSKGVDVAKLVKGIQPIAFENAVWAYTLGAALAIKKGVNLHLKRLKCWVSACKLFVCRVLLPINVKLVWDTVIWLLCCSVKKVNASASWQVMNPLLLRKVLSVLPVQQTKSVRNLCALF